MFCVCCAGGELRAAGQVGGSQADAGEAGHPAACCQENVQADGHSAQQDALLQCKSIFQWLTHCGALVDLGRKKSARYFIFLMARISSHMV